MALFGGGIWLTLAQGLNFWLPFKGKNSKMGALWGWLPGREGNSPSHTNKKKIAFLPGKWGGATPFFLGKIAPCRGQGLPFQPKKAPIGEKAHFF